MRRAHPQARLDAILMPPSASDVRCTRKKLRALNWGKAVLLWALKRRIDDPKVLPSLCRPERTAILITNLDDSMHQALMTKYLAYQPRDSFEGLPPIQDEACVKWVWKMIQDGTTWWLSLREGKLWDMRRFSSSTAIGAKC